MTEKERHTSGLILPKAETTQDKTRKIQADQAATPGQTIGQERSLAGLINASEFRTDAGQKNDTARERRSFSFKEILGELEHVQGVKLSRSTWGIIPACQENWSHTRVGRKAFCTRHHVALVLDLESSENVNKALVDLLTGHKGSYCSCLDPITQKG